MGDFVFVASRSEPDLGFVVGGRQVDEAAVIDDRDAFDYRIGRDAARGEIRTEDMDGAAGHRRLQGFGDPGGTGPRPTGVLDEDRVAERYAA